jgi:hypothetical protein
VTSSSINPDLVRSFEEASAALIQRIREAIRAFDADPPAGWESWELWRTPEPWKTPVLSNLERYHGHLESASHAYEAGDIEPITLEAASYAGLAKDLDFDTRWMKERNRLAVEEALDRVVGVADQIHRLGYDELAKAGRV